MIGNMIIKVSITCRLQCKYTLGRIPDRSVVKARVDNYHNNYQHNVDNYDTMQFINDLRCQ